MALSYGFYNSYNGDRKYNTEQISSMFDGVINDGVFDSIGEIFATIPGEGMQVLVKSGKAWFNHTWLVNDAWYPLHISNPDVTRTRIDAIVIEVDHSQDVRQTSIKVVDGLPSAVPQKPSMVETDLVHQHPIAYVTIQPGVMNLTATDIEINVGKSGCPFVTSILESVAIDDLFNSWAEQFQTFIADKEQNYQNFLDAAQETMEEWMSEMRTEMTQWIENRQTEFDDWWNYIRDTLDPDAGAIVQLASDVADLRHDLTAETNSRTASDSTLQSNIDNAQSILQAGIDTKQNKITATGILKGDGLGGVVSATRGTDYDTPGGSKWCVQIITESQDITIREDILNPAHIMAVGGGGSGAYVQYYTNSNGRVYNRGSAGGGAGYFVETDVNLVPGKTYSVVIGAGGQIDLSIENNGIPANKIVGDNNTDYICSGSDGFPTKFGTLVTANGGKGGKVEYLGTETFTSGSSSTNYTQHFVKGIGGDGSVGGASLFGPPGNSASFGGSTNSLNGYFFRSDNVSTKVTDVSHCMAKYFGNIKYSGGNGGFYGGGAYPNGKGGYYGGDADKAVYDAPNLLTGTTIKNPSNFIAPQRPIDFFDELLFKKLGINLSTRHQYDGEAYIFGGHGYSVTGGCAYNANSSHKYVHMSASGGGKYGMGYPTKATSSYATALGGGYIVNGNGGADFLGGTAFLNSNSIPDMAIGTIGSGGGGIASNYDLSNSGNKYTIETGTKGSPGILILFYRTI